MLLEDAHMHELNVKKSRFGQILGDETFIMEAEKKYDRREEDSLKQNRRVEDQYFQPIEKIIFEFQHKNGIKIDDIDSRTYEGKRLRGEFLVLLRDLGGLKYGEIKEFDLFSDMAFNSLGSLYFHTKQRKK